MGVSNHALEGLHDFVIGAFTIADMQKGPEWILDHVLQLETEVYFMVSDPAIGGDDNGKQPVLHVWLSNEIVNDPGFWEQYVAGLPGMLDGMESECTSSQ